MHNVKTDTSTSYKASNVAPASLAQSITPNLRSVKSSNHKNKDSYTDPSSNEDYSEPEEDADQVKRSAEF